MIRYIFQLTNLESSKTESDFIVSVLLSSCA